MRNHIFYTLVLVAINSQITGCMGYRSRTSDPSMNQPVSADPKGSYSQMIAGAETSLFVDSAGKPLRLQGGPGSGLIAYPSGNQNEYIVRKSSPDYSNINRILLGHPGYYNYFIPVTICYKDGTSKEFQFNQITVESAATKKRREDGEKESMARYTVVVEPIPTANDLNEMDSEVIQKLLSTREDVNNIVEAASNLPSIEGGLVSLAMQNAFLSKQVAVAREHFWSEYPDRPGLPEALVQYAALLNKKAIILLSMDIGKRAMPRTGGAGGDTDAGTAFGKLADLSGNRIDGGYTSSVQTKFNAWSDKIGIIPNPESDTTGVARAAFIQAMPEWKAFCTAEMTYDFLKSCSKSSAKK